MNILIIGGGGREHAILKQVSESPKVQKIYCAPGNAGMANLAELVPLAVDDIAGLVDFAKTQSIDLTVVGPELPLTLGLVDAFVKEGLRIFGPTQKAAILEGSKTFTKEFCGRHGIPTGGFKVFTDATEAKNYLTTQNQYPAVIKADGLAAGKGVVIAVDQSEALAAIDDMLMENKFGEAGSRVVIEEFLKGEEASFIVVSDGQNFVEFTSSQDHKAVFDGDKGPNTGGMGAYTPAPIVTDELRQKVRETIIEPTIEGMRKEGMPYQGFLYAGLMILDGEPQLLEYNCRLGDPEAEVLLPMLKSDFIDLLEAAIDGQLDQYQAEFHKGACVCVVLASEGYPASYPKGIEIKGLDSIADQDVYVFHAGTKQEGQSFKTNGGRVLTVSAQDDTLPKAIQKVYAAVPKIQWEGMHYRKDIGAKGLKLLS